MEHVFLGDLLDYLPSKKMASKLMEFKWYKECIHHLIEMGIEDPHIKGDSIDGAKVHPMLAVAILTHFRFEEVTYILYKLLEEAGIEPLNYIVQNIPEADELLSDGSAYIYAVKNDVTGLTKIGMTGNPKRRLKDLDTGNGVKLSYVLCEFVQNCSTLENKLHNTYLNKKKAGEWFKLTEDDISNIVKMVDDWFLYHQQRESLEHPSKFCHRICENCGRQFGVFFADIIRGKGMFCDNACAAQHRKSLKLEKKCKICNAPFKTIIQSKEFCSTECERLYSIIEPSYTMNVEVMAPVGKGSRISHRVCQLCHRVIALQDDKISTGQGVYCSKSCARISQSKTRYDLVCENCGIKFSSTNKEMKFCSIECEILKTGDCTSYALSEDVTKLIADYKPFVLDTELGLKYNIPKYRSKICEECGQAFEADIYDITRSGRMFCSNECQHKNINTPTKSKVCKICGVIFKTISDADFCSESCKQHYRS